MTELTRSTSDGSRRAIRSQWAMYRLAFPDRLARLTVRHPVNRMRGWHACPFCEVEYPIRVEVDGERQPIGDAEIRVSGTGGRAYAAPTLISHYVDAHRYRPPEEFVDAVLRTPGAAAE